MSADLIFYPESARDSILDVSRGMLPPKGWIERLENAGLVRTEEIEPAHPLGRPYVFIVHTKLNKRVYRVPELLEVRGSQITIGVLKENSASGTLPRIEKQFVMILPNGSIDEFDRIAAKQRALDAQERIYALHKSKDYDAAKSDQLYKIINEEWEAILARYPLLFAGPNIGLGAGVGWWPALEDAFSEITGILNTYQGLTFNAVQIKEKFGGLRFYYDCGRGAGSLLTDELLHEAREKVDYAVMEAERKAHTACEICGQPGKQVGKGWIKTLCNEHQKFAS